MDTSEQYVKMCDCPEIQSKWNLEKVFEPHYVCNKRLKTTQSINRFGNSRRTLKKEYTWLPRQDQIQDMMGKDYENTLDMLCDFYAVITVDQPTGFQQMFEVSMEQLWLAFYMYEKHGGIWDGEKWVKK